LEKDAYQISLWSIEYWVVRKTRIQQKVNISEKEKRELSATHSPSCFWAFVYFSGPEICFSNFESLFED